MNPKQSSGFLFQMFMSFNSRQEDIEDAQASDSDDDLKKCGRSDEEM